MKAKHVTVVAGLALGLMSGAAQAALMPVTYNIDFSIGSTNVTGTIVTDGVQSSLQTSDIVSINLSSSGGASIYTYDGVGYNVSGNSLYATANSLFFTFSTTNTDSFNVNYAASNDTYLSLMSGVVDNGQEPTGKVANSLKPDLVHVATYSTDYYDNGQQLVLGTVASTSPGMPSTVPLPASAPMFGAALMALGAVGYGLKRKGKAATA